MAGLNPHAGEAGRFGDEEDEFPLLEDLRRQHANQLEEYRELLQTRERMLEEEKQRNATLKETIDGQAKKLEGLREYFEHKLEQAQDTVAAAIIRVEHDRPLPISRSASRRYATLHTVRLGDRPPRSGGAYRKKSTK